MVRPIRGLSKVLVEQKILPAFSQLVLADPESADRIARVADEADQSVHPVSVDNVVHGRAAQRIAVQLDELGERNLAKLRERRQLAWLKQRCEFPALDSAKRLVIAPCLGDAPRSHLPVEPHVELALHDERLGD